MPTKSLRLALHRICAMLILAALTVPLVAGRNSSPWDQTDWKHWTAKDVHNVLSKSPWVARCCRDWDTMAAADQVGADPGFTAIILSSHTVREALVRHMQLDKRYEKLDSTQHQEIDRRIDACLNEKFDDYIVLSFSFLGNPRPEMNESYRSRIYVITSDGRKIGGHQLPISVAMTCGASAQGSDLGSLRIDTSSWSPFGPRKEVAFPRFVDGKPTIAPKDTTIRVDSGFRGRQPATYSELDFKIAILIYQGKPDF
jgi:hypothetical protein